MAQDRKNKGNVPNLRFPGFEGEWEPTILAKECVINPKTPTLENEFIYIDLESVVKGELINTNQISKSEAPSRAQRVLSDNDVLYQCVRPYQLNNYIYHKQDNRQWVASTGYAQIRTKHNVAFLYQLLNSPQFNQEVMLRCTGTSYPAITGTDLGNISISICYKEEQEKIGSFLSLIDQRISTQNKIIEDLKLLKNTISKQILGNSNWRKYRIKEIGELGRGRVISTSEIRSQHNPKYPVYSSQTSNNGVMGHLDTYDFEGEYLTWTTDGANAGTVFYRQGKFNCTNVCGTIRVNSRHNPYFVARCLQLETKRYVSTDLANPKLMNNTMASIELYLPDIETQNFISRLFIALDEKYETENDIYIRYINEKKHLLSNLFV
jgi:type I restriction enzyme S subunit